MRLWKYEFFIFLILLLIIEGCVVNYDIRNSTFVVYYGEVKEEHERIANAKPFFVILGNLNQTKKYIEFYKSRGIKVVNYIPSGYGNRDINEVKEEIAKSVSIGVDGIFLDEVEPSKPEYYKPLYSYIRSLRQDVIIIFNPGIAENLPEWIFESCDIVCVENQYDKDLHSYGKEPKKFMAIVHENYGAESFEDAKNKVQTFLKNGGFWIYITEKYQYLWQLPSWLENFLDYRKSL